MQEARKKAKIEGNGGTGAKKAGNGNDVRVEMTASWERKGTKEKKREKRNAKKEIRRRKERKGPKWKRQQMRAVCCTVKCFVQSEPMRKTSCTGC